MKRAQYIVLTIFFLSTLFLANDMSAQVQIGEAQTFDYSRPREYEIGGITASGSKYIDPNMLVMASGLQVGSKIKVPGDAITDAIRKLWDQGLFEDVNISATNVIGDKIFLDIKIKERPRVSKFSLSGISKTDADDIRKIINISRGDVATEHLYSKTRTLIENFYYDKGFLNADVTITPEEDTTRVNYVILNIDIDKKSKVRIAEIVFEGNEEIPSSTLKAAMKDTKERGRLTPLEAQAPLVANVAWDLVRFKHNSALRRIEDYFVENFRPRIFKTSKYIESKFEDDKVNIIEKYNAKGYRDAYIISDSIYKIDDKNIGIAIKVNEGDKYRFRNITWVGNTKYDTTTLNTILGLRKGDTYNKELLNTNLTYNPNGLDVSSLYMDDGYLFFQIDPTEVCVENDSIDLEIRIREGEQARLNRVTIKGNTKTNDNVAIREMRTRPGQLFSRNDVIRTTRELATLGFFNNETINPNVMPNMQDGTVDIQYEVEESSSDQIEASAGYGYSRLMLNFRLSFNNFSTKNMFKKEAWRPIPGGSGQKLQFLIQIVGWNYQAYSASFTEPWLGGRKPNSLTSSIIHSHYGYAKNDSTKAVFNRTGLSFGLGRRLTWPDDYFTLYQGLSLMRYNLMNYTTILPGDGTGTFYIFSYQFALGRSSVSQPIYPRSGSEVEFGVELTPPYSLLSGKDYSQLDDAQKYKWVEMHKWKFKIAWYNELYDKLVLMTRIRFGYLGFYNKDIGVTPFHRYHFGGDGLTTSWDIDGREIIAMRGYGNETLTPNYNGSNEGGNIFTKYTMEVRYPLSLNPQATIYALAFLEAGNCWYGFNTFNPFEVKRSAGLGLRIYLPIFSMLGLDWGYGFDDVPGVTGANKSQFHFSIGGSID